MAKSRGAHRFPMDNGVRYLMTTVIKGHGKFPVWSSKQAAAVFSLLIILPNDEPYDVERHEDLVNCTIKFKFGQKKKNLKGRYYNPHFQPDELARMTKRGKELFGKCVRERQAKESSPQANLAKQKKKDVPLEGISREQYEAKPHYVDGCQLCEVMGRPCTGYVQFLAGVFGRVSTNGAYARFHKKICDQKKAFGSGTVEPPRCEWLYLAMSREEADDAVAPERLFVPETGRHGVGLYFSRTQDAARARRTPHDVVVKCVVFVARVLKTTEEDPDRDFIRLFGGGADSLYDPDQAVYVIYNQYQVLHAQIVQ